MIVAKLAKLKSRVIASTGKRSLPTLEQAHREKRIRGRALQERNQRLLQQRPLCVDCEAEGESVGVDEWDHEIPLWKGGIDDESNLRGRCFKHHKAKSERERIERQRGG